MALESPFAPSAAQMTTPGKKLAQRGFKTRFSRNVKPKGLKTRFSLSVLPPVFAFELRSRACVARHSVRVWLDALLSLLCILHFAFCNKSAFTREACFLKTRNVKSFYFFLAFVLAYLYLWPTVLGTPARQRQWKVLSFLAFVLAYSYLCRTTNVK